MLTIATTKRRRLRCIHRPAAVTVATLALELAFLGHSAQAQYINSYFPQAVPGYDTSSGVTVLSRARPLYATQGVNVGSFVVRPELTEGFRIRHRPDRHYRPWVQPVLADLPRAHGQLELVRELARNVAFRG